MKKLSPKKASIFSWYGIGAGAILSLIGAAMVKDYQLNLLLLLGLGLICGSLIYHLVAVRCPHCGYSLAGYHPLPQSCPRCHKEF